MRGWLRAAAAAFTAATLGMTAASAQAPNAPVLELSTSARALALGDAYAAAGADDAVLFYNPAQLASAGPAAIRVSGSVQPYAAGAKLAAIVAGRTFAGGRLAAGLRLLDYGDDAELVPDPDFGGDRGSPTGRKVGASEYAIGVGYGMGLGYVNAGVALSAFRQNVADLSGGAFMLDAGLSADFAGGTVALALQNLGGDVVVGSASGPLPQRMRIGLALPTLRLASVRIGSMVEAVTLRGADARVSGGVELAWRGRGVTAALRGGLMARRDEESTGAITTAGLGLAVGHWTLDWAAHPAETFGGTTHRIGIGWAR